MEIYKEVQVVLRVECSWIFRYPVELAEKEVKHFKTMLLLVINSTFYDAVLYNLWRLGRSNGGISFLTIPFEGTIRHESFKGLLISIRWGKNVLLILRIFFNRKNLFWFWCLGCYLCYCPSNRGTNFACFRSSHFIITSKWLPVFGVRGKLAVSWTAASPSFSFALSS